MRIAAWTMIALGVVAGVTGAVFRSNEDPGWRGVVERSMPAVVRVERAQADTSGRDPGARSGSGFVIDPAGYVLTNSHVVAGREELDIRFADGRVLRARLVDDQPWIDLAILKVDVDVALPYLGFADSGTSRPGESVLAIGSPLSYPFSVTAGIVSGVDRTYTDQDIVGFLQHDAAINPGSSGSPLLDSDGRVVGINTAIADEDLFDIGISLAIPASVASRYVETVMRDGAYEHAMLGVRVRALTPEIASALSLETHRGLLVEYVRPGSAASCSGIAVGDILTHFGEEPLSAPGMLGRILWERRPGDRTTINVQRGGRSESLDVALQGRDESVLARFTSKRHMRKFGDEADGGGFGIEFIGIRDAERRGGARVLRVDGDSIAQRSGLFAGDRVIMLNGQLVESAEHALRIVTGLESDVLVALVAREGAEQQFIVMPRAAVRRQPQSAGANF